MFSLRPDLTPGPACETDTELDSRRGSSQVAFTTKFFLSNSRYYPWVSTSIWTFLSDSESRQNNVRDVIHNVLKGKEIVYLFRVKLHGK